MKRDYQISKKSSNVTKLLKLKDKKKRKKFKLERLNRKKNYYLDISKNS
jgi:hypothetical protein